MGVVTGGRVVPVCPVAGGPYKGPLHCLEGEAAMISGKSSDDSDC